MGRGPGSEVRTGLTPGLFLSGPQQVGLDCERAIARGEQDLSRFRYDWFRDHIEAVLHGTLTAPQVTGEIRSRTPK